MVAGTGCRCESTAGRVLGDRRKARWDGHHETAGAFVGSVQSSPSRGELMSQSSQQILCEGCGDDRTNPNFACEGCGKSMCDACIDEGGELCIGCACKDEKDGNK